MVKATPQEIALHQSLLIKDETASAKLIDMFYDDLIKYFIKIFGKKIDKDIIIDHITNSLFNLIDYPEKYKPEKGTLKKYLQSDIKGDILNFLQKKSLTTVELDAESRNCIYGIDLEKKIINDEIIFKINERLKEWFPDETNLQLAWRIISRERATEDYAEILSITHLPIEDQKKEVKRHKDRIKKQLERLGWQNFIKGLS